MVKSIVKFGKIWKTYGKHMVKTSVNGLVSITPQKKNWVGLQEAEAEISVAGTLLSPQELEVHGALQGRQDLLKERFPTGPDLGEFYDIYIYSYITI